MMQIVGWIILAIVAVWLLASAVVGVLYCFVWGEEE